MVLLSSPICDFGLKMPEFKLKGIDNNFFDSQKIDSYDAILIFFICNHCPYVSSHQRTCFNINRIKKRKYRFSCDNAK